jgi:hypothetical protein
MLYFISVKAETRQTLYFSDSAQAGAIYIQVKFIDFRMSATFNLLLDQEDQYTTGLYLAGHVHKILSCPLLTKKEKFFRRSHYCL